MCSPEVFIVPVRVGEDKDALDARVDPSDADATATSLPDTALDFSNTLT
jgi:hypothetical protein